MLRALSVKIMELMDKFLGAIFLASGLFMTAAILYPKIRIRSAGSVHKAGVFTHLGIALVFLPIGVIFTFYAPTPKELPFWLGISVILGFIFGFTGLVVERIARGKHEKNT